MSLGHHVLPSARRVDAEVRRYVRSEYGERDPCWFSSACAGGPPKGWAAERAAAGAVAPLAMRGDNARAERCCPVLNALGDNRLTKGLASRGGVAGEP
ncbi:MAG: hypothetical protein AB1793_04530 [Candidatus Thermoplasmatota archaeon]